LATQQLLSKLGERLVAMSRPRPRANSQSSRVHWRRFVPFIAFVVVQNSIAGHHPQLTVVLLLLTALLTAFELPLALLFIPLGMVRTSYVFCRCLQSPPSRMTPRAVPALYGARALLRRPTEAGARFIEQQLAVCSDLSETGVLALALVALARGERERAVGICLGLASSVGTQRTPKVTRLAVELLALDAAARGDWQQVGGFTDFRLGSHLLRLLAAVARRALGGARACSQRQLWLRWLLAQRRLATFALVRQVASVRDPAPVAAVAPGLNAMAQLALRPTAGLRSTDIAAACQSLDALRTDEAWSEALQRRATELQVNAHDLRTAVLSAAESDLAEAMWQAQRPAAWLPLGETAHAIREKLRLQRFDRAEHLANELVRRTREEKDLDEADEWLAWGQFSNACDELLRDSVTPEHYAVLFRLVHNPLWNYGYRQCFQRGRRTLGRQVFRRQQALAKTANALETFEKIGNNVAASATEWLPHNAELKGEALYDPKQFERTASWVQLGALVPLLLSIVAWLSHERGSPWPTLLGVGSAVFLCVVYLQFTFGRLVRVLDTENGIVLQTRERRHAATRAEVNLLVGRKGMILIHLARAPYWLPRKLWTMQATPAAAEATVANFRAQKPAQHSA
jgi:hypothetical protein